MQCFICTDEQCQPGTGRLVDGNTAYEGDIEGHVEICFDSQWFRLCADGVTTQDVEVACRHLGFTTGGQMASRVN